MFSPAHARFWVHADLASPNPMLKVQKSIYKFQKENRSTHNGCFLQPKPDVRHTTVFLAQTRLKKKTIQLVIFKRKEINSDFVFQFKPVFRYTTIFPAQTRF